MLEIIEPPFFEREIMLAHKANILMVHADLAWPPAPYPDIELKRNNLLVIDAVLRRAIKMCHRKPERIKEDESFVSFLTEVMRYRPQWALMKVEFEYE